MTKNKNRDSTLMVESLFCCNHHCPISLWYFTGTGKKSLSWIRRCENREFVSEYEYTFRWTMIIGSVFCAHRSVNISTECNEFSRFYKMESVTLWAIPCWEEIKSLETGMPPALCIWHSAGGVFSCLSFEPVHLGAAFDSLRPRRSDGSPSDGVHQTAFHRALSADGSAVWRKFLVH